MSAPLPRRLPDRLPAYLPGRIHILALELWPPFEDYAPLGVSTTLPRYGMDLHTLDATIDPDRVRWLTERTTTRPLEARHAHLTTWRGLLHVVAGRHTLAAHLATGGERIPVKLVRPRSGSAPGPGPASGPGTAGT